MSNRRGWMVCSANSEPYGEVFSTVEQARVAANHYPPGAGYHVRLVNVYIEVLGTAPEPWLKGVDHHAEH